MHCKALTLYIKSLNSQGKEGVTLYWSEKDHEYLLPAYNRLPLTIVKGDGCYLIDEEGRKYLDMFAGVGVNQLGYNHPQLNKALLEQSQKLIHSPFHFHNPVAINYAKKLSELSINGKVFFSTSGAEAAESLLKMLYKYKIRTNDKRKNIVVFNKSFHGRTLGAISFTRQTNVYQDYPGHFFNPIEIEPNDIEGFIKTIEKEKPLAFLMEPVLGSGGVIPISDEFMKMAKNICESTNTLLIIDEIQSGMGRTGTFFSYQSSGIIPDCILFGKGAGGGIPLGGVIVGKKIEETYKTGDHGTTWAHPPLATYLGSTLIDVLFKENLINCSNKAKYLFDGLMRTKHIHPELVSDIRYKGLMFGITFNLSPQILKDLQILLIHRGVLIDITQGNIIRLLPPLIINKQNINEFLSSLNDALEHLKSNKFSLANNGGIL